MTAFRTSSLDLRHLKAVTFIGVHCLFKALRIENERSPRDVEVLVISHDLGLSRFNEVIEDSLHVTADEMFGRERI